MQNSVISIRITSLYGSQPSCVDFGWKMAPFGSEYQVSMCPRYHLSFWACTTTWLAPDIHVSMNPSPLFLVFPPKTAPFGAELQVSMGTRTHLPFCGCKKTSESLVSMGPCPHLWFLEAKQRLLDQNNKSLWVPDTTCHFVHAKQRD